MDAPCPHKYSRRLNKILPPDTHPYDMRIPTCCIHACVCDLSEDCGIKECAFFNLDPEMEKLAHDASGQQRQEKWTNFCNAIAAMSLLTHNAI